MKCVLSISFTMKCVHTDNYEMYGIMKCVDTHDYEVCAINIYYYEMCRHT